MLIEFFINQYIYCRHTANIRECLEYENGFLRSFIWINAHPLPEGFKSILYPLFSIAIFSCIIVIIIPVIVYRQPGMSNSFELGLISKTVYQISLIYFLSDTQEAPRSLHLDTSSSMESLSSTQSGGPSSSSFSKSSVTPPTSPHSRGKRSLFNPAEMERVKNAHRNALMMQVTLIGFMMIIYQQ